MSKNKKSEAHLILESLPDLELFKSELEMGYAKVVVNNNKKILPLQSEEFKRYLIYLYMTATDNISAPKKTAIDEVVSTLEAKAFIEGKLESLYRRVAKVEDKIYLDLCNSKNEVVEVSKDGWSIVRNPEVNFIRTKSMLPLPRPKVDGKLELLKEFINFRTEDDFKLLTGWLLSAFRTDMPLPILILNGEQGSAKSTTTKVLNRLIDYSEIPVRTLPNNEQDLAIAAFHTWLLSFDNVSGLTGRMSDSLCKMSTGGAQTTRKLFENYGEAVLKYRRPVILNGIGDIAQRQDLLDRAVVNNLPSINQENRQFEKDFWQRFEKEWPFILGGIMNTLSVALKSEGSVHLDEKPRMADFVRWVTAAEGYLGWPNGEFLNIYENNKDFIVKDVVYSDPFGFAVLTLMEERDEWEGNVNDLLSALERHIFKKHIEYKDWPTERKVRERLSRLSPGLRRCGIYYTSSTNKCSRYLKLKRNK
ncbi:hypothetical protein [Alkalibacillus haloalkaliphilus]|uniref:hypothetical protein n=1 Tax=Alkalibacillus haloalkaliphilus TaxID=94136 RepID=UPI0003060DB1|nr:hypothetical protein [Alkalibacillus haloalkaliphilus]